MSNFAAAVGIGLSGVDGRLRLRIGVVFGFFEVAMPVAGLLLGNRVADSIGSEASYSDGALLVVVGIYTIVQARRSRTKLSSRSGGLFITGAVLSIDNLVVGFALGAYKVPIALAAIIIAVISVGMSLLGLEIGNRLGASVEKWSSEIGGLVLIFVGIAIATGVF